MDFESRLSDVEQRYDQLSAEMASPDVAVDRDRLRRLGKDLAELAEIVGPYREYKDAMRQAEEAGAMAATEQDPEMAALGPLRREIVRKALLVRVDDVPLERYFRPG